MTRKLLVLGVLLLGLTAQAGGPISGGGGGGGGSSVWGTITGTLSNQTDLQTSLDSKRLLSTDTARVDPSGNDSTGTIGDLGKPFLTVQAAIDAIEAGSYSSPSILFDGAPSTASENVTTSLPSLAFRGIGPGFTGQSFNSLTSTKVSGTVDFEFYSCSVQSVTAQTTGKLFIGLDNTEISSAVTNSGGEVWIESVYGNNASVGSVTAAGVTHLYGIMSLGTVSAPGFNVVLGGCIPEYSNNDGTYSSAGTINSVGSEVWVTHSVLEGVFAATTLHLIDSRVVGTNNATSTVYEDVLLVPKGTNTNNDAVAGNIGEYVSSLIAVGSPVSLSTGTAANVTSISLTAGDWDVEANVNFSETTSTVTARSAGISTTSVTLPTDGSEAYCGVQSTVTSEKNSITLPRKRVSVATTTTVYLVGKATFSAGTCSEFGTINARRVR